MHRALPLAVVALLPGCVLETEDCGAGFVLEAGRCVLTTPAPPFAGGRRPDARVSRPIRDAGPPVVPVGWADFTAVLVVDGTDIEGSPRWRTPGVDLDAVSVEGDDQFGVGRAVLRAEIVPWDTAVSQDPGAALGAPDAIGPRDPETFVSLGGVGGRVLLRLALERPLAAGDVVTVHEVDDPSEPPGEQYQVFLCPGDDPDDAACAMLGVGVGTRAFTLP
ncbi:MAG: hypothetical protein H6704_22375 [Myxococcales bacterium]|nr:hypothetical protein [Myxococcales bacterium]